MARCTEQVEQNMRRRVQVEQEDRRHHASNLLGGFIKATRSDQAKSWSGGVCSHPESTRRWINVELILGQRLRRWPNINPTLDTIHTARLCPTGQLPAGHGLFRISGYLMQQQDPHILPSKCEIFTRCWFNFGSAS